MLSLFIFWRRRRRSTGSGADTGERDVRDVSLPDLPAAAHRLRYLPGVRLLAVVPQHHNDSHRRPDVVRSHLLPGLSHRHQCHWVSAVLRRAMMCCNAPPNKTVPLRRFPSLVTIATTRRIPDQSRCAPYTLPRASFVLHPPHPRRLRLQYSVSSRAESLVFRARE